LPVAEHMIVFSIADWRTYSQTWAVGAFTGARVAFMAISFVLATFALPLVAAAAGPHGDSGNSGGECAQCHAPHQAASEQYLFADRADSGQTVTQAILCYTCHDGTSATNVKTGENSFAALSGHAVEERDPDAGDADLTNTCSACHWPHRDPGASPGLPRPSINGRTVTGAGVVWCVACHDEGATQSWYASISETPYPPLSAPVRDVLSGYPVSGTYPGSDVYTVAAKNAHLAIPAFTPSGESTAAARGEGDCLWCHASHRGVSAYDGLIGPFAASTAEAKDAVDGEYAGVCFTCHATDGAVPAPDIKSLATGDAVDSGHTIRSNGALYPKGAPLPCYECHNPHGSSRGNAVNISDALGQNLDPRDPADPLNVGASAAKVRQFCFSCHVTYDADGVTGRPWAWSSTAASGAGAYVPVASGAKAIGLDRAVALGVNNLRLPLANGHNVADTGRGCYECHGDVHKPMSGVSNGGVACSVCHAALNGMVNDTSSYHHVLDDPDWDQAPGAGGVYPTDLQSLSCVSCHVDHSDYESLPGSDPAKADGKAFSLRSSATVANPAPSDTDDTMCLSCHTTELDRNTVGQKANTIPETKVWSLNASWWAVSPHNYDSPGQFNDGSTFNANCAKCHGNLQGTLSSGKFSVHFSAEQRLLNALGDTPNATLAINEEQMCFRCHSKTTDNLAGIKKPNSYRDWYGTEPMSESNVVIYSQMNAGVNTFGHKPHLYANKHLLSGQDETQAYISANKHVECADCHNHHVVGDARHTFGSSNAVSEAIRGVTGIAFNSAALSTVKYPTDVQVNARLTTKTYSDYEYEICLKCHSSANTNYNTNVWGGMKTSVSNVGNAKPYGWSTYTGPSPAVTVPRWTNVAADFSLGNQSRHPVIGPLPATDPGTGTNFYGSSRVFPGQLWDIWTPGDTMYCSDCHGDSTAPLVSDPDNINHAQGPHGSSIAFSLRGPRTDWPVATTGTGAGQLITMNMLTNTTYDNLFCSNCHPGVRANKVHGGGTGKHAAAACVNCHTLIPHGGGMSRLIADGDGDGDANIYEPGEMPARFSYNNDKRTSYIASFRKRSDPNAYVRGDCTLIAAARAAAICGTQHLGGTNAAMENW